MESGIVYRSTTSIRQ